MSVPALQPMEPETREAETATHPADGAPIAVARLLPFAVCALVLLVAILTVTPWPVGAFQDDAIYTVLAKSLATGEGFRLINLPGAPNATHYPPGYPLVLAALWRLWPAFPQNIVLFKFANAFFLSLAAWGTWTFARARLGWTVWGSAAAALVGTLSIVVLLITGVVLSEPLFMAALLGGLILAERSVDRASARDAAWAGLALAAVTMVRTIGVAAVGGLLLVLVARRRWRAAVAAAGGASLLLVPWQLWVAAHAHEVPAILTGKYGSYGTWLSEGYRAGGWAFAGEVLRANLTSMHAMLSFVFLPVQSESPRAIAMLVLVALALRGLHLLWRQAPVSAGFLVLYTGITLAWPFEPNRFLLAVWPLLMVLLALPLLEAWRLRPRAPAARLARGALLLCSLPLALGFGRYNWMGFERQWWTSVQRDAGRRAKPIAEWVAQYTRPSDVLSTDDDLIVYLYTGRRSVPTSTFLPVERVRPLTNDEDLAAARALLSAYAPRFFITASKQGIATATTLTRGSPPLLAPRAHTANALVYERLTP